MQPEEQNQNGNQVPAQPQSPPSPQPDQVKQPQPQQSGAPADGKRYDYHDYSFITDPYKPPKKGLLGLFSGEKGKTFKIIGLGIAVLLTLLIGYSLIFGGDDSAQRLLKLAQTHTELKRVSEIGESKARSTNVRNFATTTRLTLDSSESAIMGIVNKAKKPSSKELAAGENPKTDELLVQAEQRNQFDEVYIDLFSEQIQEYRSQLKVLHEETSSKKNKETYGSLYNELGALLASLGMQE